MPDYRIVHSRKTCQRASEPLVVYRLHAEVCHQHQYVYQDLLVGECGNCKAVIMAWLGIDKDLRAVRYYGIKLHNHQSWLTRTHTDLKEDSPVRAFNSRGDVFVIASRQDRQSLKWRTCRVPVV